MQTPTVYRIFVAAILGLGLSCPGQTNPATPPTRLFRVPEAHLRFDDTGLEHRSSRVQAPSSSLPLDGEPELALPPGRRLEPVSLSMDRDERGYQLQRRIKGDLDLIRQGPGRPAGFAGVIDSIFRPEVYRVRKVYVSCSVLNAIKRKNPLPLLNPVFLHVSW